MTSCSARRGKRLKTVQTAQDRLHPGPVGVEVQDPAPASADEPAGDGEQVQAQPFGFGYGVLAVEGEQLHPGEQVLGEEDELEPDLVGGGVGVGQVR